MSAVEFPYCKSDATLSACVCDDPCILVQLTYGKKVITVEGLVDSGCTTTLADLSLAEVLGVNLETCLPVPVEGVGGKVQGHMTTIGFNVEGFDSFNGNVIFVENLPVSVLLGQQNFFDNFNIHFKKSEYKFILEKAE